VLGKRVVISCKANVLYEKNVNSFDKRGCDRKQKFSRASSSREATTNKNLFQMKFTLVFVIFVAICCVLADGQGESCGRKFSGSDLSFGGEQVQSNEWPWLVALIYSPKNVFFCSGSLISSKHVISGEFCQVCD
jgi:Trypsin